MAKDFTLHHHIARPVSVHFHNTVAAILQHSSLIMSVIFMAILLWLIFTAETLLKGAPLHLLITVLIPLKAAIILLSFLVYYKTTLKRELKEILKAHELKLEHGYKHQRFSKFFKA